MPNRKEHQETGGAVGLLVGCCANILVQADRKRLDPNYQFNMGELAGSGLVGYAVGSVGGMLPDVLEPAYCPGHRDLFHSVAIGTLAVVGAKKLNDNRSVSGSLKMAVNAATAGYVSHLVLDGQTPSGLPLLTRR